ncbi:MAG: 3,4-dihydroxy-2-butanone-4-phosphate synthase [Spirochaetaceae bacterium]|nr:3,4-dihydroxy-2-butanone-4-phosphate synthase [Spirochaetaceae bacterium]
MENNFIDVETALEDIRQGKMLIVTDDEGRENEGDLIMAAQKVTPDAVNFMTIHARGLLCQSITAERARELDLPPMVAENTSTHTTAFTISVDVKKGATTGISAFDRAATIHALVDPATRPDDLGRPGHIFPLIAREGGVLTRGGHTEAACDLARLAGLSPSGILCEVLDDDGQMARLPRLQQLTRQHGLHILTVARLIEWRQRHGAVARRLVESRLPTRAGNFSLILYENAGKPDMPNLALVSEKNFSPDNALVRVHSECLTGDMLMSLRCDCGSQLFESMRRIAQEGGVLVYLRQEGRGIGLTEKIRAYQLQDEGLDTVDANLKLGHAVDEREYEAAIAILRDLGISGGRLLTNNPDKVEALAQSGFVMHERAPLEIKPEDGNRKYLAVKKSRLGHYLKLV